MSPWLVALIAADLAMHVVAAVYYARVRVKLDGLRAERLAQLEELRRRLA